MAKPMLWSGRDFDTNLVFAWLNLEDDGVVIVHRAGDHSQHYNSVVDGRPTCWCDPYVIAADGCLRDILRDARLLTMVH